MNEDQDLIDNGALTATNYINNVMPESIISDNSNVPNVINSQNNNNKNSDNRQKNIDQFKYITGINRTPVDTLRDVSQGALIGLGKGGQSIANILTGGNAPNVDMDKMFSSVGSPNPSVGGQVAKGIGDFAPYGVAGGASLLGQLGAGAAYGGLTSSPNEKNLFGILPNGRLFSAIENAGITGIGHGLINAPELLATGKSIANYMNPGKAAEEYRGNFGEGTTKENIENLGKRVQFAKQSSINEALIPKNELYSQEGKSNVYDVNTQSLPEGNLPKLSQMIDPSVNPSETQMNAISSALKNYRKTGDINSFFDKSEDIFNIPELPEKSASKIEDVLSIPTERDSKYFSEPNVDEFYSSKGKLNELHNNYKNNSNLLNYDFLQSELGNRIRKLQEKQKANTSTDIDDRKLESYQINRNNLLSDKQNFMQTLPKKMQNLENEFRQKYATNVGIYEDAPTTIKKLASGRWNEVTSDQVGKAFTNLKPETMKILQHLGSSAGKNIIYNALQKVKPNDAEGMANTILELKRTKGYDKFIDNDMENWAHNMLSRVSKVNLIKKGLKGSAGALTGGLLTGNPLGALIGAEAGAGFPAIKHIARILKK